MNEVLTTEEIERCFHAEWVLVADTQVDEERGIVGGRVLFHGKDRDEVDRKLLELRPRGQPRSTRAGYRLTRP